MKRWTLLLSMLLSMPCLATTEAEQARRLALANELMSHYPLDEILRTWQQSYLSALPTLDPDDNSCPAQREAMAALDRDYRAIVATLSVDPVARGAAMLFADVFDADEIQALIDFYDTPVGAKMLRQWPAVAERMSQLTLDVTDDVDRKLQAMIGGHRATIESAQNACAP